MSRPSQLIAPIPNWLCLQLDPNLHERWNEIAGLFAAAAQTVIGDTPPQRAVVRLRKTSDGMEFRFHATPALPIEKFVAVKQLAGVVSRLGNALQGREQDMAEQAAMQALDEVFRGPAEGSGPAPGQALSAPTSSEDVPHVNVFKWDQSLLTGGGADRGRDADTAARIVKTLKRLQGTGPLRPLSAPPAEWQEATDTLAATFPNFKRAITSVIRPHLALLARGIRHRLPPLLLVGPPGIGKTFFARSLAQLLSVPPPLMISIATETNGSALSGSSTFWANASPGKIFEFLAWGERGGRAVADGLVVLDEVDKVGGDLRYDPLGALYTLLARMFHQ